MTATRILLLTGRPGIGKTTVVREVAARLTAGGCAGRGEGGADRGEGGAVRGEGGAVRGGAAAGRPSPGSPRVAGFFTRETRDESGRRTGFVGETFEGQREVIASVDREDGPRVSKYGVDVEAVEALTEAALGLRSEVDVYLIDEIGKMECLSERFVEAVRALLDSGKPVVATVGLRGDGLIASAKRHPAAALREVTRENRDALPRRIVDWLADLLAASD